jgi:ribosomal protein S18 acetylase RimI-like enzyme
MGYSQLGTNDVSAAITQLSTASKVTLRPETPVDEPFLFDLYATTRDYEMDLVPWTEVQKRAFLNQQCAAQLRHYRWHYPDASYRIVLLNSAPIGRMYVRQTGQEMSLIDISLVRECRGRGIGTRLIRELLAEAETSRKRVSLYVEIMNPACRLYERLGFRMVENHEIYLLMEWQSRSNEPHPPLA